MQTKATRRGFSAEEVEQELERGGRMSLAAVLRVKMSYFVDGGVIGGGKGKDESGVKDAKENGCCCLILILALSAQSTLIFF